MIVTFLIGNGFDIAYGLKTKYADFIRTYISNPTEDETISEFKQTITDDLETWCDAELAFGLCTDDYDGYDEGESLRLCYDDFVSELTDYLYTEQMTFLDTLIDSDLENTIKLSFTNALLEFPRYLVSKSRRIIRSLMSDNELFFEFVNFNYTSVFDRCLSTIPKTDDDDAYYDVYELDENKNASNNLIKFWANTNGERRNYPYRCYYNNKILHIHGQINSTPIMMGVNDYSQISNKRLLKNNRRCERTFIKPFSSTSYYPERKQTFLKRIKLSSIICVYGMSLGCTDDNWWKEIAYWLVKNKHRHLIILPGTQIAISTLLEVMMIQRNISKNLLLGN